MHTVTVMYISIYIVYIQLARQGLNIVILSRSEQKLQKVMDEISKKDFVTGAIINHHNPAHKRI